MSVTLLTMFSVALYNAVTETPIISIAICLLVVRGSAIAEGPRDAMAVVVSSTATQLYEKLQM